ncbi:MAG: hypothetical protein C4K47_01830 [Candidatus Thorarchaeota archaeon]|nr:MAG: hypothetical protein C4K47_01830 [Candidatus Thorarchaeota archaeon]
MASGFPGIIVRVLLVGLDLPPVDGAELDDAGHVAFMESCPSCGATDACRIDKVAADGSVEYQNCGERFPISSSS